MRKAFQALPELDPIGRREPSRTVQVQSHELPWLFPEIGEGLFMGVLLLRALLFGLYIRNADLWKLSHAALEARLYAERPSGAPVQGCMALGWRLQCKPQEGSAKRSKKHFFVQARAVNQAATWGAQVAGWLREALWMVPMSSKVILCHGRHLRQLLSWCLFLGTASLNKVCKSGSQDMLVAIINSSPPRSTYFMESLREWGPSPSGVGNLRPPNIPCDCSPVFGYCRPSGKPKVGRIDRKHQQPANT